MLGESSAAPLGWRKEAAGLRGGNVPPVLGGDALRCAVVELSPTHLAGNQSSQGPGISSRSEYLWILLGLLV